MSTIGSWCAFYRGLSSQTSLNACLKRSSGLLVSRSVCADAKSSSDDVEGIEQNRRTGADRHGHAALAPAGVSGEREDPYAGWRRHPRPTRLNMVVDRSFDARHNALELERVHLQTRLAVELSSALRGSDVSLHLYLANYTAPPGAGGVREDGKLALEHAALAAAVRDGSASHSTKEPWELYPKDRLVYLSPDSDNILQDLEQDKVYVLGGIVDLEIEPNITLDKAEAQGILHARLPLLEHFQMRCHTYLPMNQACEMLVRYARYDDWPRVIAEVVRRTSVAEPEDGWVEPRTIGRRQRRRRRK